MRLPILVVAALSLSASARVDEDYADFEKREGKAIKELTYKNLPADFGPARDERILLHKIGKHEVEVRVWQGKITVMDYRGVDLDEAKSILRGQGTGKWKPPVDTLDLKSWKSTDGKY